MADSTIDRVSLPKALAGAFRPQAIPGAVCEAGNGHDALGQLAQSGRPWLIFLDLTMPEMDGLDRLRTLRQRPHGGIVPVVVLTAEDMTSEEGARLDQNADRVVSKGSLRRADLAEEVRTVMTSDDRLRRPETM